MKLPLKVLSFGSDTSLLLPEDSASEGQYRQARYCELLGQERAFVILNSDNPCPERVLAGGRLHAVSAPGKAARQRVATACARGLRLARRFRPDIVEYQEPSLAGFSAWLVATTIHRPLVGGVFNDLLEDAAWTGTSTRRQLAERVGRWVLRHTRRVRCDSEETTAALRRRGYEQVDFIPFYIPWLATFAASNETQQARLQQWQDNPQILCVARLSPQKNFPLLLRAFAQARATVGRGSLVVAGDGPSRPELESLASQLGICDNVRWLGAVAYSELPPAYRFANLFVLSSDAETSARVLILAQTARLPTITTATSGARGIIRDGINGLVVPVGDADAMARALRSLLADEALYRRMLFATEHYDHLQHAEAKVMPRLREFYECAVRA